MTTYKMNIRHLYKCTNKLESNAIIIDRECFYDHIEMEFSRQFGNFLCQLRFILQFRKLHFYLNEMFINNANYVEFHQ